MVNIVDSLKSRHKSLLFKLNQDSQRYWNIQAGAYGRDFTNEERNELKTLDDTLSFVGSELREISRIFDRVGLTIDD